MISQGMTHQIPSLDPFGMEELYKDLHSGNKQSSKSNDQSVTWQATSLNQALAIDTHAHETLYCGTRGCGKTFAQLLSFHNHVGRGYGEAWQGILFDTEYKPLKGIVTQSRKIFRKFRDGAQFRRSPAEYCWVWPGGETLYFRFAKKIEDIEDYLGHEYPWLGYNELSKWGKPDIYDLMLGTQRSYEKNMPRMVFSTTNPWGKGTVWIRRRFVDPAPYGTLMKRDVDVPQLDGTTVTKTKTKICIRGHYSENKFFSDEDVANLMVGIENRPEVEGAWLHCDWNAANVDGAIGDLWTPKVHIVPNFNIPKNWHCNRAFDWGSSTPFSIGWFAESNGEEVRLGKRILRLPHGSVIMFAEWYGARSVDSGLGLRLSPSEIAKGIVAREQQFVDRGWVSDEILPGPADNQIKNVVRRDQETIETTMRKLGVVWTKSDKSAGSRAQGLQQLRQRLHNALRVEGAGFYIMRRCSAAIDLLPPLQLKPNGEDIDDGQLDHIYDMVRYRLSQRALGALDARELNFL